jgi:predicted dehydrogenase
MNKPIKLGMVGLGRAGKTMHLEELEGKENLFEIYAVCDLKKERSEEFKEKFGCKIYDSIEELVEDPEIEVVDIATRSCDHYKHAKTALDAGKTVFLEKPMSESYEEARKLMELGEKYGERRLFIRHNRRFEAKFMHLNKIIESGILGDVYFIRRTVADFDHRKDW